MVFVSQPHILSLTYPTVASALTTQYSLLLRVVSEFEKEYDPMVLAHMTSACLLSVEKL